LYRKRLAWSLIYKVIFMLKPLEEFFCDTCREIIDHPKHGWVEWDSIGGPGTENILFQGFRIVHLLPYSPLKGNCSRGCNVTITPSHHLIHFMGQRGIVLLLSMIDNAPFSFRIPTVNSQEWAELFRRTQLPYYEEARFYFKKALDEGFLERGASHPSVYSKQTLKRLIEKYSDQEPIEFDSSI